MSTELLQSETLPAQAAASQRAKNWIISPVWDLVFLIAAPLAIVPLVSLTAAHWLDVEEISLVVISFATLGHHLPGFLRAYGDRDLFARFWQRFVWGPPLVFAAALFSAAYGLHGLALILLFWATWHGLMQTYGFMRIYDLKQGPGDRQSARLDFLLCLVIFTAGVVFSDARVYGIADIISKTGLPIPGPRSLAALRWIVGASVALVIGAYLVHLVGRIRRGTPLAWPRVALALSTGWLYWLGGVLATDLLVGVATFEIFHALQYDAIVWAYNRGRARKPEALVRPLGAMFQFDRWASLGLYVALIAAFSSIRLMGEVASDSWTQRVLMAVLTTSTFMHFYFDGFIWKVSERKTQDSLAIADRPMPQPAAPRWRPGHVLLCVGAALLAVALITCELARQTNAAGEQPESLANLTALTPQLPELQWRLSEAALANGDTKAALDAAAAAVLLRPHSQQAFARLGAAQLAADRLPEAAESLREAARLGPRRWNNHCNLGIALGQLAQWEESNAAFQRADELQPDSSVIQAAWARMCERRHDDPAAIEHYRRALAIDPTDDESRVQLISLLSRAGQYDVAIQMARTWLDEHEQSAAAHLSLGKALVAAAQFEPAIRALVRARELTANTVTENSGKHPTIDQHPAPQTAAVQAATQVGSPSRQQVVTEHVSGDRDIAAAACYEMAVAQLQLGQLAEAEQNLHHVLKLDPKSSLAYFQLGNLRHAGGDLAGALQNYRQSLDLQDDFAPAYCNLATILLMTGDAGHARKAYERALSLAPDDGSTHYNLGLLLLNERDTRAAREHLLRAHELGITLPAELEAQLRAAP